MKKQPSQEQVNRFKKLRKKLRKKDLIDLKWSKAFSKYLKFVSANHGYNFQKYI
jgi:predicted DNA binding CopG/RHH family protein